jgi:hypothetical protein
MIAVKNHQYLHELLTQEELIRAVANHYIGLTGNSEIKSLYNDIISTSRQNSAEIVKYLESHI